MSTLQNSLPAQTATKAHASALAMLALQIVLAFTGVTDVSPAQMLSNFTELAHGLLSLGLPTVGAWLVTFYTPNKPKK